MLSRFEFQSLKGFQPKWNCRCDHVAVSPDLVSIPKRVSAKVQHREVALRTQQVVSIPKRVSAKVERSGLTSQTHGASAFQSLKGFQPKWNKPKFKFWLNFSCFNP